LPATVAVPPVAGIRPVIIRIVVVLPAPFGPRKPVTVPGSSSNDTWSTTVRSPYFLVSPLTVIISVLLVASGRSGVTAQRTGMRPSPASVGSSECAGRKAKPRHPKVDPVGHPAADPDDAIAALRCCA
jgi:hypothetical protein